MSKILRVCFMKHMLLIALGNASVLASVENFLQVKFLGAGEMAQVHEVV